MDSSTVEHESLSIFSSLVSWLRRLKRRAPAAFWRIADEVLRCTLMLFILKPAARLLSRQGALSVARWCGAVMLHVPTSGRSALAAMRMAFGMEVEDARRSAREYLAQPFYSFVVFYRILHRREHPNDWKVEERNREGVVQLRELGRTFVVATGHFRRESFLSLYMQRICPGPTAGLFDVPAARSIRPHHVRIRIQFGQMLRTVSESRQGMTLVFVGGALKKLLKHLEQPGSQVVTSVDAFWKTTGSSTRIRPFAGMRARSFSTGVGTLCRLAQCPIIPCASYVERDGTIILEWGSVVTPPLIDDVGSDIRITDKLLNFIESAIGRQPTQYALYIGEERRWDPATETWNDPEKGLH